MSPTTPRAMWRPPSHTRAPGPVLLVILLALLGASFPGRAAAAGEDESTKEAARAAYDRGAAAYDAGDYGRAAAELTRADQLIANDVALELATKAAVKADDARVAMTLAARAERRGATGALAAAAQAARSKMTGRTGSVDVKCPHRPSCTAKIDGVNVPAGEPLVVLVGDHRVVFEHPPPAPPEAYDIKVGPDAVIMVTALPPGPLVVGPPPVPHQRPTSSPSGGISPAWFYVSLGLTAVVGGVAIASAVDTRTKHDDFAAHPSVASQQAGLDAQLRTNLLGAGVALAAIVTAATGLFFVQWSSPPPTTAQAGP